jgi:hypothetical protein
MGLPAPLRRLVGVPVVAVDRGPHRWSFDFESGASLAVECLWRVRAGGRLRLTAKDDAQRFGLPAPVDAEREATTLLRGKAPASVRLDEGTGDLVLSFPGDVALEVLADSAGYEAWQLHEGGDTRLVCQGGGTVVEMAP